MSLNRMTTLFAAFLAAASIASAGEKITKTLHVSGNCNSCKKAIEKPLKSLDGMESASWNKDTKQLSVTFDADKLDVSKIMEAVAGAGYDADTLRATDEAYSKLPKCCKYRDGEHK